MPLSNQQTPVNPDLLNTADSSTLRLLIGVSSNFDRSILGIPAEDDEFTRGLTFLFDPSTGQASVPSMSQESEGPEEVFPYEPSRSSNNTSSRDIFTPQSVSDASGGLHPRIASSRSVGSSDGGSSVHEAAGSHTSSLSANASTGTSKAASSPMLIQTPTYMSMVGSHTTTMMSPAVDSPIPESFAPLEDMIDPRTIIHIDSNDVRCLEEIMSLEDLNRLGNTVQASDPMDFYDKISQPIAPSQLDIAQGSSKTRHGAIQQGTETHKSVVARRTQRASRLRPDPAARRASTKDTSEAKLMRELGSCLPCLVIHEKCKPGTPCPRCLKASNSSNPRKTPCVRQHLSEAELFRKGALSFPDGLLAIQEWASNNNVTLTLYHAGLTNTFESPKLRPWLKVVCRKYHPTPGARCSKSWTKGTEKFDIHLPPFAMTKSQHANTAQSLQKLLAEGYEKLVAELATGQDDGIISCTLAEAVRQAETCPTIKGALTLSILSRLASKSFNIFGEETLGILQEEDPECPYYKRIPIPPLLDAQIDVLLMEAMERLRKKVLSGLRVMITDNGRKRWFKIYLTISVLLFNLESVYQNQLRQINRYQELTQRQTAMLQSWEKAAQNLLDHFRAVCRGHIPLNMEWSKTDQDTVEVDDHSLKVISHLKELAHPRDFRETSNASPNTPNWISALFAPEEEGYMLLRDHIFTPYLV